MIPARKDNPFGIHHEDPKNTKSAGTLHSLSVLYKVDRTSDRLSHPSFVLFVAFVVSLGEDLGNVSRPTLGLSRISPAKLGH